MKRSRLELHELSWKVSLRHLLAETSKREVTTLIWICLVKQ